MKLSISNFSRSTAACASILFIAPNVQAAPPLFVAGQVLVRPAPGLSDAKFAQVLSRSHGRALRKLPRLGIAIVQVQTGKEQAIVDALAHNPNIAFAELNRYVKPTMTANDPALSSQWHLSKMQALLAWDIAIGTGVTVAVLDTGVYPNHPDLLGKIVVGRNVTTGTASASDTSDIHGHGTLVSGVVTALTNNATGGASVAPGTQVMPIRITDRTDGYATFSDMASGITWAADHGARVANLSYDGAAGSSAVASAASYMMSKNGVVVVAAGNGNIDYGYSNNPYLYVAAATDATDAKASFSSFGNFVDIAAPGTSIYTTNRSGTYSLVQGTSFSTPNVAGVAAVVMAANPLLSPSDVLSVISSTAFDLGTPGWDKYFGYGRVNELAAAQKAVTYQPLDTTAPTVSVASPTAGAIVSGLVGVQINASDSSGVTSVALLVDGTLVATSTTATNNVFSFSWNTATVADGAYSLTARATDNAGNVATSTALSVSVKNAAADTLAPTVTLSNPTTGQKVGTSVSIAASSKDNVGMKSIAVYGDGTLLCSSTASVSCSWNTRKFARGSSHTVSAIATDLAGNTASASVNVIKQ